MESLNSQFNTNQSHFKYEDIKPQYGPSPVQEGFIINGKAIAAIASAEGNAWETYSVVSESLPYLPENRRQELFLQTQSVPILKEKNRDSYEPYGRLYKCQKYPEL